jgi:hypothetical protein
LLGQGTGFVARRPVKAATIVGPYCTAKDELELFFSRLKEGRRGFGPYLDVISVPNMDKIYTGQDISDERNKFLRYFLAKLNTVIRATRDIETLVRDFIGSCNSYLSSRDLSTSLPRPGTVQDGSDIDDKFLTLSRRDLKVSVESVSAGRTIPLPVGLPEFIAAVQ